MDYTALRATLTDYYMHKVAGSVEDLRVKVYEMHSDINIRASSISFSVSLFLLSLVAFFSLFLFLELFLPFTRFGIQTRRPIPHFRFPRLNLRSTSTRSHSSR